MSSKRFYRLALRVPSADHLIRLDAFLTKKLAALDSSARHALLKKKEIKLISTPPTLMPLPPKAQLSIEPNSPECIHEVPDPLSLSASFLLYRVPTDADARPVAPAFPSLKPDHRVTAGSVILLPLWIAKLVGASAVAQLAGDTLQAPMDIKSTQPAARTLASQATSCASLTSTSLSSEVPVSAAPWTALAAALAPLSSLHIVLPPVLPSTLDEDVHLRTYTDVPLPARSVAWTLTLTDRLAARVLAADGLVVAIDKPAGLSVHAGDHVAKDDKTTEDYSLALLLDAAHALSQHYTRYVLWLREVCGAARLRVPDALDARETITSGDAASGVASSASKATLADMATCAAAAEAAAAPAESTNADYVQPSSTPVVLGSVPAHAALLASLPGCPYTAKEIRALAAIGHDLWHARAVVLADVATARAAVADSSPSEAAPPLLVPTPVRAAVLRPGLSRLLSLSPLRLVHRLDKPCAGTLFLARSRLSAAVLGRMFREGSAAAVAVSSSAAAERPSNSGRPAPPVCIDDTEDADIPTATQPPPFVTKAGGSCAGQMPLPSADKHVSKCYWALTAHVEALPGPAAELCPPAAHPLAHLPAPRCGDPAVVSHADPAAPAAEDAALCGWIDLPLRNVSTADVTAVYPTAARGNPARSRTAHAQRLMPPPLSSPAHGEPPQTAVSLFRRAVAHPLADLWLLSPLTGRKHQLRVHAASPLGLGAPLWGEDRYHEDCRSRVDAAVERAVFSRHKQRMDNQRRADKDDQRFTGSDPVARVLPPSAAHLSPVHAREALLQLLLERGVPEGAASARVEGVLSSLHLLCRSMRILHPAFCTELAGVLCEEDILAIVHAWGGRTAVQRYLLGEVTGYVEAVAAPPPHMSVILAAMGCTKLPAAVPRIE